MISEKTMEVIKPALTGAGLGIGVGFIKLFSGAPDSHTLDNQIYLVGLIPQFALMGAVVGFLLGRIFGRY